MNETQAMAAGSAMLKQARCYLCKSENPTKGLLYISSTDGSTMLGMSAEKRRAGYRRSAMCKLCDGCAELPDLMKRIGEKLFGAMAPNRN